MIKVVSFFLLMFLFTLNVQAVNSKAVHYPLGLEHLEPACESIVYDFYGYDFEGAADTCGETLVTMEVWSETAPYKLIALKANVYMPDNDETCELTITRVYTANGLDSNNGLKRSAEKVLVHWSYKVQTCNVDF